MGQMTGSFKINISENAPYYEAAQYVHRWVKDNIWDFMIAKIHRQYLEDNRLDDVFNWICD